MKFRRSTFFRFWAFLTLVLCAPMHVLAAGPYVWCVGPHDHAVIESAATETHHGGHHHDINDVTGNSGAGVDVSHDNSENCIDLALGHDGQLVGVDATPIAPQLVELPCHLDPAHPGSAVLSSLFYRAPPSVAWLRGPPETGDLLAGSLIIQHGIILLI